jgi:F-type H+-transporting ATPase subunit beta
VAKGTIGKIVQIIGAVVDVEFPEGDLPEIYHSLELKTDDGQRLVLEVQQHLGSNWVRCIAMATTDRRADHGSCGQTRSRPFAQCAGRTH